MPTAEEIVKLKPGPNLDMLVHVHVMQRSESEIAPPYSSDIGWAFKVVNHIRYIICDFSNHDGYLELIAGDGGFGSQKCKPIHSNLLVTKNDEPWCCHIHPGISKNNTKWPHLSDKHICVVANTIEHAICLAALAASPYAAGIDCTNTEAAGHAIAVEGLKEDLREAHDLRGPVYHDKCSIVDANGFELAVAFSPRVAELTARILTKELES